MASDWQGASRFRPADRRSPVPLPAGVACYAIASTAGAPGSPGSLLGDGLVPVDSAQGRHKRQSLHLGLPDAQQWLGTASATSTCCATRRSTGGY